MHIVTAYSAAIFVASTLAALFNTLLIYLYYRCPLKYIKGYKYFFLLTAVQDLLASICIHLTAPRIAAQNSYLVYVATGPIYTEPYADYIMLIFFLMMSSSIIILTNSFAYRYVQLCLPKFSYIYDSWRWITAMIAANLFIFLNFLFIIAGTTVPNDTFKKQVYDEDLFELGSFTKKSFVGLSMKYSINGITIPVLADCVVIMSLISILGVFFAISIQRKLQQASLSERTRRLQQQLFQMLLLQVGP
ncbi:unnamed protein product [Cylicocyclus nassatus]|uniref:Uncharacterized protein n=1 Tax=Cylicocyclus nassatus TaxID=53992 RepID=A0AA36MCL6_CYLNA|nr:unnamed protein product [Cylicocyclus nassatus]